MLEFKVLTQKEFCNCKSRRKTISNHADPNVFNIVHVTHTQNIEGIVQSKTAIFICSDNI